MKNCTVCKTRIDEEEGQINDAGKFVCLECSGESPEEANAFCKSCGELMEEGVCALCGTSASDDDEDEDEDKAETE